MEEPGFRKILAAFDGSDDSARAARLACSVAKRFGATLTLVHVYSFVIYAEVASGLTPMPDIQPLEDAAKAQGKGILQKGLDIARSAGVQATGELIEATSVVQAIIDFASQGGFDLIVVGTKGRGGFRKMIMGSVSSGLSNHANCPVLVVR